MDLQVGWLLHRRPYKENSVIASYLVAGEGRVDMVVHRVRTAKRGYAAFLQPFIKVLLSCKGRGNLKTLTKIEFDGYIVLTGRALFCGFYINELMLRSMISGQDTEESCQLYERTIVQLASSSRYEPVLRAFELDLLKITGYAPTLDRDMINGNPIVEGQLYRFKPQEGLIPLGCGKIDQCIDPYLYPASVLLALSKRDFHNPKYTYWYKRLMRQALTPILGGCPVRSRELFRSHEKETC